VPYEENGGTFVHVTVLSDVDEHLFERLLLDESVECGDERLEVELARPFSTNSLI
jgi:hypothetical protein